MMIAIPGSFSKSIAIDATASKVWNVLTQPGQMKLWMLDNSIQILTSWEEGSGIIVRGDLHGHLFENIGKVLRYYPLTQLTYTHLSSISALPDVPESYTTLDFSLAEESEQTILTITCSNFPTESIYKHLLFYWNGTLGVIKKLLEGEV